MLSGEDFGYLKNEEQNKLAIIAKKAFLLGAVLLSISCFVYITINAYYFVYHDKNSDIEVIKSPPQPIKIIEQGDGLVIKNIDKTIYDNIVGNPNLAKENLNNVRVIEQVKTPLVKKNNIDLIEADLSDSQVKNNQKISNSAIVVNDTNNSNQGKMLVYGDEQNNLSNSAVVDMSLVSNNKPKSNKGVARVQIAALTNKDSAIRYWHNLKKSHHNLVADLDYFISEANLGAKGTFYRLQIGNFRSQIEAENFCRQFISQLKQSKTNCIIVE